MVKFGKSTRSKFKLNPLTMGGGGGGRCTYALASLFAADAPMKKKSRNLVFPRSQSTLKYGSENRPWVKGLTFSAKTMFAMVLIFQIWQNLKDIFICKERKFSTQQYNPVKMFHQKHLRNRIIKKTEHFKGDKNILMALINIRNTRGWLRI